ncbi:MAG: acyltransferase [Clostridia bacterium]|nr:acyltransferase [Clostridia bacterium]
MSLLLFVDRIKNKITRSYRKAVFKEKIGCKHKNFQLIGRVNVVNTNITLGKNVMIYPDVMFHGDGPIILGDNITIGNGTVIYASKNGGVTIGSNTMVAAQSYIIDADHGTKKDKLSREQEITVEPVFIGEDVWIAANVTVTKGSKIHSGAVIGAKALVRGEIPENAIAVGIPAKVIKERS